MMENEKRTKHNYGELSRNLSMNLRKRIAEGEIAVGNKLPSNRELAEKAGVSQVTARMAVLQLAREGILEIRKNCGTYVKCLPLENTAGFHKKPQRIGVILSPWDTENTPAWDSKSSLSEILRYASRNECQIMIFSYQQWRSHETEKPHEIITKNNLDTLVWFYTGPHEVRFIQELERLNFRQLILNRRTFGINAPAILHDEAAMAKTIFSSLTKTERASMLLISASREVQPYADRLDALLKLLEADGSFDPDSLLILPEAKTEGDFPEWTRMVLKSEMKRTHPEVVIDWVGYINFISKIPESFYQDLKKPRFISTAPPTAWKGRKNFHYTCFDSEQQSVNKAIHQFFERGGTGNSTIRLPYIKKEI